MKSESPLSGMVKSHSCETDSFDARRGLEGYTASEIAMEFRWWNFGSVNSLVLGGRHEEMT